MKIQEIIELLNLIINSPKNYHGEEEKVKIAKAIELLKINKLAHEDADSLISSVNQGIVGGHNGLQLLMSFNDLIEDAHEKGLEKAKINAENQAKNEGKNEVYAHLQNITGISKNILPSLNDFDQFLNELKKNKDFPAILTWDIVSWTTVLSFCLSFIIICIVLINSILTTDFPIKKELNNSLVDLKFEIEKTNRLLSLDSFDIIKTTNIEIQKSSTKNVPDSLQIRNNYLVIYKQVNSNIKNTLKEVSKLRMEIEKGSNKILYFKLAILVVLILFILISYLIFTTYSARKRSH